MVGPILFDNQYLLFVIVEFANIFRCDMK